MRVTKLFLLTTLIISGAALMGCTKKAESNKNADSAKKNAHLQPFARTLHRAF